jgi:polyribonucleotide nucleotidyltransferase
MLEVKLRSLIREILLKETLDDLTSRQKSIIGAIKQAISSKNDDIDDVEDYDLYKIDDDDIEVSDIIDEPTQLSQQIQKIDTAKVTVDDSGLEEISNAYPKMSSYADDIIVASQKIGIDPKWLANVINFESGGNPKAINKISNATGLIQFMPKTASKLGTSTSALYGMTGKEQMKYVQDYFIPYQGRLNSQEDVYMAVFYPKAIGRPDYKFPPVVVKSNPGIETPRDYAQKANRNAKLR